MIMPTIAMSDLPIQIQRFVYAGVDMKAYNDIESYSSVVNELPVPKRLPVIRCIEGEPLVLKVNHFCPPGVTRLPTRPVTSITIL